MNKKTRFNFFAILSLASSLLLTLIATHFAKNYFESERESRFKEWSMHAEDSIENRMQAYIDTIASTQAMFSVNPNLTRRDFRRFVDTLDIEHKYPGLVSFGFARRISASEKTANERQVQSEGFPEYHIKPEGERAEYYPVTFVEPLTWKHQQVLGFDLGSEAIRLESLRQACDTGLPTVSGIIRLQQDRLSNQSSDRSAFFIVAPVYQPGAPLETAEDRRKANIGFVYNAFRANDLFRQILGTRFETHLPLEVKISDGTQDSKETLYDSRPASRPRTVEDLSIPFQIAGRRWTLSFWREDSTNLLALIAPILVLIFGGAITFLWWALLKSMREAARVRDVATLAESKALRSELERENMAMLEREATERFKQLADAMPQIVWVCRFDGKFEYANNKWRQFTTATDSDSSSWMQFVHRDDLKKVLRAWKSSMTLGSPFECEHRLLDKGHNKYHWFLTRALPYRNQQGVVEHWFGTCTDIQEQKEIESQLTAAVSLRDEFLSIASHELKTPLTPLRLQIQLSERMLNSGNAQSNIESLRDSCRTSVKQIDRMTALIENLLDVSRIQAGKLELQYEETDLSSLVREVANRFSIQRAGRVLPITTLAGDPVWARFDRLRMEQVVSNLVSNAIKYGQDKPIEITVVQRSNRALIEVRDRGMGIDPALQEKIFERFERAVTGRETSGLGLGLFIVRQILMAHEGNVRVESTPGQGSLFVAEIPLGITAASAASFFSNSH